MKTGIYIGRFQPFHKGHMRVVDRMYQDKVDPCLLIGSTNIHCEYRSPFSYSQRVDMIKSVYPEIIIRPLQDIPGNDEKWVDNVLEMMYTVKSDQGYIIYYTRKEEDLIGDFHYIDHFHEIHPEIKVKQLNYCYINGTDIRKDLEGNRDCLDSRVYNYIKDLEKE